MNDYVKKKTFGTVSGLPKFQRDDSNPNGFSAMEPKEERTFSSMLDKYKKNPVKQFNNYDKTTYPSYPKQQEAMSTWDILKADADDEARRGNYKPRRELKKIEARHNMSMQKQRYEDFKKKKREENKKKPVADNFSIDTTGMKEVIDYREKNGTLDGIFREPLKESTMYGEPETFDMTVDEFIQKRNIKPQQEYGIGSMDKPTETTKNAFRLLRMFNDLEK